MKYIVKNVKIDLYKNMYEYLLFDTEKGVRSRVELQPEHAKIFAKKNWFVPTSPIHAKQLNLFSLKSITLNKF